mmetsp:Transcript_22179/g.68127  ORF Transcript_22179/g.68127 Transcript_22179/m.68127 type:complete len:232 (-) Transcript_22179:1631-2326(-)
MDARIVPGVDGDVAKDSGRLRPQRWLGKDGLDVGFDHFHVCKAKILEGGCVHLGVQRSGNLEEVARLEDHPKQSGVAITFTNDASLGATPDARNSAVERRRRNVNDGVPIHARHCALPGVFPPSREVWEGSRGLRARDVAENSHRILPELHRRRLVGVGHHLLAVAVRDHCVGGLEVLFAVVHRAADEDGPLAAEVRLRELEQREAAFLLRVRRACALAGVEVTGKDDIRV